MRGIDGALSAVGVASGVVAIVCAVLGVRAALDDRAISALAANHDRPVSSSARAEVLIARLDFLLRLERLDDAQAWSEEVGPLVPPPQRAALLYNLANARLRNAFVLIQRGRIDLAAANVRLAKEGYRRVLAIDPGDWNARYNLEMAMRVVRDFPQMQSEVLESAPRENPRRLWADLPRQPRGLP